ncbi:histidine kinase N-terminal 7TM domain-containing protein [Halobaculum litoreum]|uniref:histidine kinase N-terminal 7TM domain-containing protein n=1 Tax=Halobaculum litoreum TaxID=3031998 RepID=UPI0024C27661|nr:histidine kinase N-terminal 7TM domain-containing protein [Halobaculum sp. DT92]
MTAVAVALPVLSLLAAAVSAGIALVAYRRRTRPGALALAVLTLSSAVWTASSAVALGTFDPGTRQAMETLVYLGRGTLPVAWLVFAVSYAGLSDRFSPAHLVAVSVVPATAFLLTATAPLHDLLWTDYRVVGSAVAGVRFDPGPLFYLHVGYSYALIGLGTLVLGWALAGDDRLRSMEGVAVALGSGLAFVASLSWLFGVVPVPGVDPTPMVLSVSCVLFAVVVFRRDLIGRSPAPRVLGRRVALEGFSDAVLITDAEGRVVDANASARERLPTEPVGEPVAGLLDAATAPAAGRHDLRVPTVDGPKPFSVSVSPVRNRFGRSIGSTCVLRDVSGRERREQRLAVLSRVLRHNLRNDVNVIRGHAATADGATADDDRAIAAMERSADRLAGLSRKAGTVERVVAAESEPVGEVDVGAVFGDAVDRVAASYPAVRFESTVEADRPVRADREVLYAVAENLVENAAKHGDGTVRVATSVAADGAHVEVVVVDDGPGLPDQERETLLADTERPLQHSSGLGLWVVRWGVGVVGGRLDVSSADPTGTRIAVELPAA